MWYLKQKRHFVPYLATNQNYSHQVGNILGRELQHDIGTVELDSASADTQSRTGRLAGGALHDEGKNRVLPRREVVVGRWSVHRKVPLWVSFLVGAKKRRRPVWELP